MVEERRVQHPGILTIPAHHAEQGSQIAQCVQFIMRHAFAPGIFPNVFEPGQGTFHVAHVGLGNGPVGEESVA